MAKNPETPEPITEKTTSSPAVNTDLKTQPTSAKRRPDASGSEDGEQEEYTDDEDDTPKIAFSKARCIAIVATTTGASFMNTFSIQSTVIILPVIGRDLDIPSSRLQWIVSAYALAFGCFLLLWGRIADIYGKRIIFASGTAWVAVISAINPFLKNEIAFSLFRGLHGLGAAANVPTAIGILGTLFPPGKAKNYAFSTYAAGAPLGSVFGNLIAGFIAEYTSWKWVFGVMAIVSGIIAVISLFVIPAAPSPPPQTPVITGASLHDNDGGDAPSPATNHPRRSLASIDWIGGALVTVGILILLFALTEGNVVGWSTPWVPTLIVVSLLVIAAFVAWQWYLENRTSRPPLMKVSVFKNRRFSAALVIMGLFFSSFNNFLIYATYFFQEYQDLSTLQTTLRFIPTGVMGAIVAAIVAPLLSRIPTQYFLLFGNACVSLASLLFAVPISPKTTYFAYGLPAMCLSVMGADTTWPSLTLFTSQSLPPEDQALGGALINAVGQVGRSIGLAISTTVQTAVMAHGRGLPLEDVGDILPWDEPSLRGLRAANWTTFALGVCSFFVVAVAFRGTGIVGKAEKPMPRQRRRTRESETPISVVSGNAEAGQSNVAVAEDAQSKEVKV
ncbi:hypothetical protein jhhlp_001092 [Lomentospora prolificans]|uniref:Major facilitator superfamily (MFS) profile domain-containing protein n=1 Tax=Lomentospora prolificans TaxID=41688 RepID=A0A2N3NH60_9PEZI|nr:hypothetical protein jhhlp_001092 [Lomentospora prolificans]